MHRHSTPGAIAAELKGPKKWDGHGFADQAVVLRRYATGLTESFFKKMKRDPIASVRKPNAHMAIQNLELAFEHQCPRSACERASSVTPSCATEGWPRTPRSCARCLR